MQALQNQARDGDTITLPAGTFSWTSRVDITKGITLKGETMITGAGTANPTVNSLTIIQDNSPRSTKSSGVIRMTLTPGQSGRITGLTITHGTSTVFNQNGVVQLVSTGNAPNYTMRVDHCFFDHVYDRAVRVGGWCYGVMDHNVVHAQGNGQCFFANNGTGTDPQGHGPWADYSWFGTNKFFFMEDNTVVGNGIVPTSGSTDGAFGARFVIRHNYFITTGVSSHGTEGNVRGNRACEMYDNIFNWNPLHPTSQLRSGNMLAHDNTWLGQPSNNGAHTQIVLYRAIGGSGKLGGNWGTADGTDPWDMNATEGNGTYVEGHAPHLYESGTVSTTAAGGVMIDKSKSWARNQWVGYSVRNSNPSAAPYKEGSYIIANTATTLTYWFYTSGDRGPALVFDAGDSYEIHKVLSVLDQPGRGKGDLASGQSPPVNRAANRQFWTHELVEPSMSWNNVFTSTNAAYGFGSDMPTALQGRDYYNLGAGFPANTTPPAVASTYTAALNGVDYVGPFVYPHPLVSSASVPTDVNGDGKPDYLLYNPTTRQTVIWYLNNDVLIGHAFGPTPWFGWSLVAP